MAAFVRIAVGVVGALMVIGGVVGIVAGSWAGGAWAIVAGAVAITAVVLERSRYRSEAAERAGDPGPGGGEPAVPSAPFAATDERFVDPTTGRRLRVYLDTATGERRYYADEEQGPGARP